MTTETTHPDSTLDWPGTVRRYQEVFGDMPSPSRPWRRAGSNFATPEVLGYVADTNGDPVEVSTGMMPVFGARPRREIRVFGVTFTRRGDKRSTLCYSLDECRSVIRPE